MQISFQLCWKYSKCRVGKMNNLKILKKAFFLWHTFLCRMSDILDLIKNFLVPLHYSEITFSKCKKNNFFQFFYIIYFEKTLLSLFTITPFCRDGKVNGILFYLCLKKKSFQIIWSGDVIIIKSFFKNFILIFTTDTRLY